MAGCISGALGAVVPSRRERGEGSQQKKTDPERSYETFMGMKHREPMWVETDFLRRSGLLDRFRELLQQCGWPGLLTLSHHADVEDTSEFLSKFTYKGANNGFEYVYRGEEYFCSMDELREVFGWAEPAYDAFCDYSAGRGPYETWDLLVAPRRVTLNLGRTTIKEFTDPLFFYIYFMMTRTVHGRADGNEKTSRKDLALMGAIVRGKVVDWAHFACVHWSSLRTAGEVRVGGMVTYFLRQMHPDIAPIPTHQVKLCQYADVQIFRNGKNVHERRSGEIVWTYFADTSRIPRDLTPPRPRGRPPGSGRGQARAQGRRRAREDDEVPLNVVPPAEQEQYEPPQQPPPAEHQQAHIDAVFHMNRVSIRGIVPFMPAPPGWRPGMAIPPEYL